MNQELENYLKQNRIEVKANKNYKENIERKVAQYLQEKEIITFSEWVELQNIY